MQQLPRRGRRRLTVRTARSSVHSAALATMFALALPTVSAQPAISVGLDGVGGKAPLNALARECYEAGLASELPSDSILDCTAVVDERVLGSANGESAEVIVTRHRLRFTLIGGTGGGRIAADAWTEIEELGIAIEQPITDEEYLERVQRVLGAVATRLRDDRAPPWAGRYESEQAWHLAAHLAAVRYCDARLAGISVESATADLESVGLRPLGDDARDRCEQLYTHIYEWGLGRGDAEPTLDEYVGYRAALPAAQRPCSGQLARDAGCPR
jgi:hypothetical protein